MPSPAPDPDRDAMRDRYRGCLLGLAVGDAVGTTVEFRPPGSFPPVTDMTGGGPFSLPAGAWTDDTSMALCLADSLLARRANDPADQLRRYVRWYRHGARSSTGRCFDIGGATRDALERFERTGEPDAGTHFPDAGGNGVLMRLAPLPMAFGFGRGEAITQTTRVSNTTHGHAGARSAARLFAALLHDALAGRTKDEVLGPGAPFVRAELLDPEVAAVAAGSFREKQPPEIRGRGYAVASLEAALWAVWTTGSFEEAILAAANLGDDADTTAAIAGQLAGALYGERGVGAGTTARGGGTAAGDPAPDGAGIPRHWRERVLWGDEIAGIADGLLGLRDELHAARRAAGTQPPPGAPDEAPDLPNDAFAFRDDLVLGGPYPGKPTRAAAAASLDALLDAGIRVFVDLTEEGEGPGPRGLHPYEALLRERAAARGVDAWHVRLPIRDVSVPEPWRMRAILDAIRAATDVGRPVYVHCRGGVGRTGTVLGCLGVEDGWPPAEALERLAHARRFTERTRAGKIAPETAEQRAFVAAWRPRHVPRAGGDGPLASADLTLEQVPEPWGPYDAVVPFAGTIDGYATLAPGSEDIGPAIRAANEIAAAFDTDGTLPDDLDRLRAALFVEFRRDRFTWGEETDLSWPDDDGVTHVVNARASAFEASDTVRYRRALVARIGELVRARDGR